MLCDVHHNQCLQECVGPVFIFLMGLQLYLIQVNKISFVVTGINLLNSLSGVQTPHTVTHYDNMPMQYTAIFHGCKNDNFQLKFFVYVRSFAQNIDCGYTLEQPQ